MIGSLTDYYKASCKRPNTSKKKCAFLGLGAILIRSPESTNVHLKGGWAPTRSRTTALVLYYKASLCYASMLIFRGQL